MGKIYFAHPMSEYGTPLEAKCLARIKEEFKGDEVINPSSNEIGAACKILYPIMGMDMFDAIARNCDVTVALPFPDGKYGAGVYSEIAAANRAKREVFRIDPVSLTISPLMFMEVEGLSVLETRDRIRNARARQ